MNSDRQAYHTQLSHHEFQLLNVFFIFCCCSTFMDPYFVFAKFIGSNTNNYAFFYLNTYSIFIQ